MLSIEASKGLSSRLERSIKLSLEESKNSLTGLSARLDALSPFKVLSRGYSITFRKIDGSVVRESNTLSLEMKFGPLFLMVKLFHVS